MSSEYERNYARLLPADKNAAILDLGAGQCQFQEWLEKQEYANIISVDQNQPETKKTRFIQSDIFDFLETNTQKHDLITLRFVIEHLPKTLLPRLVRLLEKTLDDNGTLIIETPNAGFILAASQRYADLEHETMFTRETLEKLLEPQFKVTTKKSIPPGTRTTTITPLFAVFLKDFLWLLSIGDTWPESAGMIAVCKKRF